MEPGEVPAAIEAERSALADLLESLDAQEWKIDSLCAGWTVHEVAAHMTMATRLTIFSAIVGMIRARGDLNRLIHDSARQKASEIAPKELILQIRADGGSTKRPPGAQIWDPLLDVLVHSQDIARPLGREHPMPLDRAAAALRHGWTSSMHGAAKRFDGVRFAATDLDWEAGQGDHQVEGPAADLLLVVTGRSAGVEGLTGSGRGEVARRLAAKP